MTRGVIPGLAVKQPIGLTLPALYHEDGFVQRFCDALDEVLAPVPSTLDNFWSYLDVELTPEDFLEYLAGWVGVDPDQNVPVDRRRARIARAIALFRSCGTVAGLAELVEVSTGLAVDVEEGGATAWSITPDTVFPGRANGEVVVRVFADDPSRVDVARIDRMVARNKPAHLAHRVEVVRSLAPPTSVPSTPSASSPPPPPPPPPPKDTG